MSAIAKVPDWDAFLFEGMYSEYVWNFDNAIEGGCICERRYNCSDAGKGKSAMGFLNEGMDNSTFYAGEDNRHHRHTSLSDKWSSPDVGIFEQMRKPLLV